MHRRVCALLLWNAALRKTWWYEDRVQCVKKQCAQFNPALQPNPGNTSTENRDERKYEMIHSVSSGESESCLWIFLIYMQSGPQFIRWLNTVVNFRWYKSSMHSEPCFESSSFPTASALQVWPSLPEAGQWQWLSHGIPKTNKWYTYSHLTPLPSWLSSAVSLRDITYPATHGLCTSPAGG